MNALLGALLVLAAQEPVEIQATVTGREGSRIRGVLRLPGMLTLKTRFGDAKVSPESLQSIEVGKDGRLTLRGRDGTVLSGEGSLGKLDLRTPGGKLVVGEAEVQTIVLEGPPAPEAAPSPVKPPRPGGAKKEAPVPGYLIRPAFDPATSYAITPDPAVFVGGTGRAAFLDYVAEEVVVVDLASGTPTRIKVESGPSCLLEKAGRLYVANRKSSSLSVIDVSTLKIAERVPLPSPPCWLAAPLRAEVVYVLMEEGKAPVQILDLRSGRLAGPLIDRATDQPLGQVRGYVAVSPDQRLFFTQERSGAPQLHFLQGNRVARALEPAEGTPGPITFDFTAGRAYGGAFAYTPDLRRRLSTLPTTLLAPHPTRSLLFGAERGSGSGAASFGSSGRVLVYDEETFAPLGAIEMGDPVLALLPAEETLYVLSPTRVYPVGLESRVPAAALAKAKALRVPADLLKPPAEADQKKSQQRAAAALTLLEAGKADEARVEAEAAFTLDPLSNAKLVLTRVEGRSQDPLPALAAARHLAAYPFRDLNGSIRAMDYLGIQLAACGRTEEALQTYYEGLVLNPEHPALLKGLGTQAKAQGYEAVAHAAWTKSLTALSQQPELKKSLDELASKLLASTTAACRSCEGTGKHEVVVEQAGKPRRKSIQECKICAGAGRTWNRPCAACLAGTRTGRSACEACLGQGYRLEPVRKKS